MAGVMSQVRAWHRLAEVDCRGQGGSGVAAVAEGRVVVTEDVTTFSAAITDVPDHLGVIYCHHARCPRTRPGLSRLRRALGALAAALPHVGKQPVVRWLAAP
jgi:hypothetical protein